MAKRRGRNFIDSKDKDFIQTAKDRFKQGESADENQRKRELDDLRFYAGDQWSDEAKIARQGQSAGPGEGAFSMPPVPARPCYVINKVRGPVLQVLNQERMSDMGIELVAADDFGGLVGPQNEDEIEVREGLCRRIQRSSQAADARTWAFNRATIAGRGYYLVLTRFLPGKSWDKEIYVYRIYNQASAMLDPAHEAPDGSDADWGFLGNDLPWDEYIAQFPKAKGRKNALADATTSDFRALGDEYPGWFTQDGDGTRRTCRVVDYWYTVRESRELAMLANGDGAWVDELPEDTPRIENFSELSDDDRALLAQTAPGTIVDARDVVTKKIKWAKIDGVQKLEETDWEGPDMPIIKVLGEELQPYDAERRAEGMVRPARNSNEGFNAMVSKGVETIGLAPIPPFQATPAQIAGYEKWYQSANTRTLPYLPYNDVNDSTGQPIDRPTRTPSGVDLTAIFGAMQMFDEAIQSTTGVPEARVGKNTSRRDQSGRALQEQRESSEQGTSNFIDNLKRSIRYEGQIINNLLYPIYGKKPGRLTTMMTGEAKSVPIAIGQLPQAMQGQTPMAAGQGAPAKLPKVYTLTENATHNVIVKAVRAFDSRRTQEAAIIGDLLQAAPDLMTWFGDLFFKNQDGPGHAEMAERAKVMLAPPIKAMIEAKESGDDIPPEAKQKIAELTERVKHAEQVIQVQQNKLESNEADNRAKLEQQNQKDAAALEKARMDNETRIAVAELGAKVERLQLFYEERGRVGMLLEGQAAREHEANEAARAREHEAAMSAAGVGAAGDEAAAGREHDLAVGDVTHQQTLEQQQQAADLAPPPAGSTE